MFNIIAVVTGLYIWQVDSEVARAAGISFWVLGEFSGKPLQESS
jgi:hypothetical protein